MIVRGRLLIDPDTPPASGWLRIEAGRIAEIGAGRPPAGDGPALGDPESLITPGFIDAHLHLPQIDSVGADGMTLLDWLDRVIFPAEIWWGMGGAPHMLRTALARLIRNGALGFAAYLTSHPESAGETARRVVAGAGFPAPPRCALGRVAMDRSAPEELIRHDRDRGAARPVPPVGLPDPGDSRGRVEVSLNPRFAISCTDELLAEVGWAAGEMAAQGRPPLIQTHLAESRPECDRVAELFPADADYTSVYDRFGLLTPRTLLAHAIHLSDSEWDLIRERQSVVVHCPTANTFLQSGLFNLDAAREHGVRLALGSDIAGGPDVAMPRVARAMIEVAKMRRMTVAPEAFVPSPADAWRLITTGGADALGWSDMGRLEVGASADLLMWRLPQTWFDDHLIGRLIYGYTPRLIDTIVLGGEPIDPATIDGSC